MDLEQHNPFDAKLDEIRRANELRADNDKTKTKPEVGEAALRLMMIYSAIESAS